MCRTNARQESDESQNQQDQGERGEEVLPKWKLYTFCTVLFADTISSVLLTLPTFFWSKRYEGDTLDYYTLYGTLLDLFILNTLRLLACFIALLWAYCSRKPESSPFQLYHPNGDRKTREELDHEALEEAWSPWIRRFVLRYSFVGEILALCTFVICIIKCLARLNVELGVFDDREPLHPLFWIALLLTCIFSVIEIVSLEHMTKLASAWGRSSAGGWMHRVASNLSIPLLSQQQREELDEEEVVEQPEQEDVRGFSDITADTSYHAQWSDLLAMTNKDAHLIAFAFVFLLLAAAAQVYIPKFTGNILDALSETFSGSDGKHNSDISVWDVPGFCSNVVKLVVASIACGVFSGLRGSIFTVVGGRVNVRLRVKLMDALLTQEVGFFDVTKTGDITSRLSSDTTLVGDQVTLNVNVFLRSLVQVIGVLAFMFVISWQLSLLAFISVPVITALSKLYGEYVRRLTKLMQKKLADGNSVSEAAIGSMTTVRSFDAAESELHEFEECMNKYLHLNLRNAIAYLGYCTCITSLPNLVTAVVLFYGGLLVRNGDMSSGQLVSFLLYLQSLSDAFGNIGYIFSSLTQAVGAADKVFELLNREPRLRTPSVQAPAAPARRGIFGRALATRRIGMLAHSNIEATKTAEQRYRGLAPSECEGAIELQDVELYYPARPQRRVLNGLSLSVRPGSVVALVGTKTPCSMYAIQIHCFLIFEFKNLPSRAQRFGKKFRHVPCSALVRTLQGSGHD
jgi:ATP-binding cassette subfamily B (MDR/TAP) protein 9